MRYEHHDRPQRSFLIKSKYHQANSCYRSILPAFVAVVYYKITGEKHQKTLSNGKEDNFRLINSKIVLPSKFNLHKDQQRWNLLDYRSWKHLPIVGIRLSVFRNGSWHILIGGTLLQEGPFLGSILLGAKFQILVYNLGTTDVSAL